ncbi:MAG: hypothetical protein ACD_9C00149G0001, partial [uncultured bacterium]
PFASMMEKLFNLTNAVSLRPVRVQFADTHEELGF